MKLKLLFVLLLAGGALSAQTPTPAAPAKRAGLIIMISVDMLSGEIMDRYTDDSMPGGLGRLLREGIVFENGYQEHAFTETGPGHSTLLSGRHPSSTGIPNNSWLDMTTGRTVYCVDDKSVKNFGEPSGETGSSPKWFIGTTFGTWLRDQLPGSRVFAIIRQGPRLYPYGWA